MFRYNLLAGLSLITITACTASEPPLPTFDPMDKIGVSEGWKVGRGIAVAAEHKVHHVQAIASNLHDIDFDTPPAKLIPVKPSCAIEKSPIEATNYLIIGSGRSDFHLIKNKFMPGLLTFNNADVKPLAKKQAQAMHEKGTRATSMTGWQRYAGYTKSVRDIFVTDTSAPVTLILGHNSESGVLQNIHLAPGARLSGVIIMTKSDDDAVAGVPDGVPVTFISETIPKTKRCFKRIQARPDESWGRSESDLRYKALKPHYRAFKTHVQKEIGRVDEDNVISFSYAGHVLVGPAPTRYEDRLPYVALGGKNIHYMKSDHVQFGTPKQNEDYAEAVLDQYYAGYLGGTLQ